ncbi:hypothetical protein O181_020259 [Austropuccinia psidii MF-1]|uniref:Reverse transcriptase Ty1/copia-type domain-containing protein n=1 Tax=Austropuccinia psidii MF-1 TaxID=1389203 RepID=A0A9Q3CAY9_9BASI|nr:hypothetical protein [Austropuccinia psidii MF-1]
MIQVQFILGIKINRNRSSKTITLSQKLYINKVLKEFGMMNCKPVTTPMDPGAKLVLSNETNQDLTSSYRKAVGLLNYLTSCSLSDLAYATSVLSQFLDKPLGFHVSAFKRVL